MARNKPPAFQLYSGDFLTGTTLMSNAEVGLYIRLMCLQAEQGSVPDDVERLVGAYGEGVREAWPAVRKKFRAAEQEGMLVNDRMVEVLAARDAFRLTQSKKGKVSAQKRSNPGATPEQPRKSRGSTPVEPIGDGDGVGVSTQGGKERARAPKAPKLKGPNPEVQAVIDYLTAALISNNVAKSLDGEKEANRWAAWSLLKKLEKDEPDFVPVDSAKALIDAAMADPFYRKNSTTVRYLLNNCGKISANFKANGTSTAKGSSPDPGAADKRVADYFARKRANVGADAKDRDPA